MITRCTPARACTRHLVRGVAGQSEGDPCGALTVEDIRKARLFDDEHGQKRAALAEQLLAVTAERDALRVRLDEEIAARRDRV